jgi:hypothetical protein
MPIAESKATETLVKAADLGFLKDESAWYFCGPFTPQLGYDGGLDFRWKSRKPMSPAPSFDLEADFDEQTSDKRDSSSRQNDGRASPPMADQNDRAKRRGFHFGIDSASEWFSGHQSSALNIPFRILSDREDQSSDNDRRGASPASPPLSEGSQIQASCPVSSEFLSSSQ